VIAQVDEQKPAMIANAMTPARQPHRLADVSLTQGDAAMGSVPVHGSS
jgi:hypothetical protein